jgi:hypothetical protein
MQTVWPLSYSTHNPWELTTEQQRTDSHLSHNEIKRTIVFGCIALMYIALKNYGMNYNSTRPSKWVTVNMITNLQFTNYANSNYNYNIVFKSYTSM